MLDNGGIWPAIVPCSRMISTFREFLRVDENFAENLSIYAVISTEGTSLKNLETEEHRTYAVLWLLNDILPAQRLLVSSRKFWQECLASAIIEPMESSLTLKLV